MVRSKTPHCGQTPPAQRIEHKWISAGSSLNPSPGKLLSRRRDTAEGCRERASEGLLYAATVESTSQRQKLEETAALWIARAHMHDEPADGAKTTDLALPEKAEVVAPEGSGAGV